MSRTKINNLSVNRTMTEVNANEVVGGGVAVTFGGPTYPYGYSDGCDYGYGYGSTGYYSNPNSYFQYRDFDRGWNNRGRRGHGHDHFDGRGHKHFHGGRRW
jgi:hypothetical protein